MSDAERHASAVTPERSQTLPEAGNPLTIEDLVSDIVTGNVSLFDLLRSAPSGDYFAFVQRMRMFHVVSRNPRVLKILNEEMEVRIAEAGGIANRGEIERELARKDGGHRFPKLLDEWARAFNLQPSLLTGGTFDACLEQYKALVTHVEKMWGEVCQLYKVGSHPMPRFFLSW